MKKVRITWQLDVLIALFLVAVIAVQQVSMHYYPKVKRVNTATNVQTQVAYDNIAKRDLLALMLAYPDYVKGVEKNSDNFIFVLMQSGKKIMYDDKKTKTYETQLANADLQDMMEQRYPLEESNTLAEGNFDPGRIRNYAFLKDVYGGTQSQTTANLTSVTLGAKTISFNKNNNAAASLKSAFAEINSLIKTKSSIYSFVYPVNGTYNYRVIAGTGLLSPHSFGMTIDLKSNPYDYWKWASKSQGQSRLAAYPKELVKTFENNNFIWGGKWAHFDILHFEYRPELIIKSKYYTDPNSKIDPWYSGYPNTEAAQNSIKIIDNALK